MKGFGGGMQQLMRQANQMQSKMKKVQEELKEMSFEGTAGGGAVMVKVNGDNMVTEVILDKEAAEDIEMLQDLILAATNDAMAKAKETSEKEMSKVTGGMAIPGMF